MDFIFSGGHYRYLFKDCGFVQYNYFSNCCYSLESCEHTLKLFAGYLSIRDLLMEKNVGGAGRRGSSSSSTVGVRFSCLLPMASTVAMLKAVFRYSLFVYFKSN